MVEKKKRKKTGEKATGRKPAKAGIAAKTDVKAGNIGSATSGAGAGKAKFNEF